MIKAVLLPMLTHWLAIGGVDPINEQRKFEARLNSDDAVLFVKCDFDGEPVLGVGVLHKSRRLGTVEGGLVEYRFDAEPGVRQSWSYQGDVVATFKGRHITPFVSGLKSANRLLIRVTDYADKPILLEFELPSDRQAIDRAVEICR